MSAERVYRLSCDAPGRCDRAFDCSSPLLTSTRAIAADAGWSHALRTKAQGVAPSLDFCHEHAAEANRPWCRSCASTAIVDGVCECGQSYADPHVYRHHISVRSETEQAISDLARRRGVSSRELTDRLINAALDAEEKR